MLYFQILFSNKMVELERKRSCRLGVHPPAGVGPKNARVHPPAGVGLKNATVHPPAGVGLKGTAQNCCF